MTIVSTKKDGKNNTVNLQMTLWHKSIDQKCMRGKQNFPEYLSKPKPPVSVVIQLNNMTEIKIKLVPLHTSHTQQQTIKAVLTAREYQRTWVFIHWEIVQLQLALSIDGKPKEKQSVCYHTSAHLISQRKRTTLGTVQELFDFRK